MRYRAPLRRELARESLRVVRTVADDVRVADVAQHRRRELHRGSGRARARPGPDCRVRPRSRGSSSTDLRASARSPGSPLFPCPGCVLMRPHDGRVDEVALAVTLAGERLQERRKDTRRRPPRPPRVHRLPGTVRSRKIAPRGARSKDPEHRLDHPPMRLGVAASRLRCPRKQRLDARPLLVAKPEQTVHHSRMTPSRQD